MRLMLFDDFRPGVLREGNVVDVSAATADLGVTNPGKLMPTIIEHFDRLRPAFEQIAASEDETVLRTRSHPGAERLGALHIRRRRLERRRGRWFALGRRTAALGFCRDRDHGERHEDCCRAAQHDHVEKYSNAAWSESRTSSCTRVAMRQESLRGLCIRIGR